MAIKNTKSSTIYSENPKMDNTGIRTKSPEFGYLGTKVGGKTVTGGKLYMEAIDESSSKKAALTSTQNLRKAAGYVGQGYSCDHAVDVVSREVLDTED